MLNSTEGREGKMYLRASHLLNTLTKEDLIYIAENGKLVDLCQAVSLDLHTKVTVDEYEC